MVSNMEKPNDAQTKEYKSAGVHGLSFTQHNNNNTTTNNSK